MENKFAALPLKMPLVGTMKQGYIPISKATKKLKSSAAYIYASYFVSFWVTVLGARFMPRIFVHDATMKFIKHNHRCTAGQIFFITIILPLTKEIVKCSGHMGVLLFCN